MAHTKFKALAAVLIVAGLLGSGLAWQLAGAQQPKPIPDMPPPGAKTPATPADPLPKTDPKKADPVPNDKIKPGDWLTIRVRNAFATEPIDGPFEVEASGKVLLGPVYGRVKIDGLTVEEAETAILKHLKITLRDPIVAVSRGKPPETRTLEQRVQQLEKEVKDLRQLVEELRNKKP